MSASVLGSLSKGVVTIAGDRRVLLTGSIASCFEAAMCSFVFMWTPALAFPRASSRRTARSSDDDGLLDGGHAHLLAPRRGRRRDAGACCAAFVVAAAALAVPALLSSSFANLIACVRGARTVSRRGSLRLSRGASRARALLRTPPPRPKTPAAPQLLAFEVVVGVYFPAMGTLGGRLIPDAQPRRSTQHACRSACPCSCSSRTCRSRWSSRGAQPARAAAAMQAQLCTILGGTSSPAGESLLEVEVEEGSACSK